MRSVQEILNKIKFYESEVKRCEDGFERLKELGCTMDAFAAEQQAQGYRNQINLCQWFLTEANTEGISISQFDLMEFGARDTFEYMGIVRQLASVDFKEKLVAYADNPNDDDDINLTWVRCENIRNFKSYVPSRS